MTQVKHGLDVGTFTWDDFARLDLDVPLHVVATDDGQPIDLSSIEDFIMKAVAGTEPTN